MGYKLLLHTILYHTIPNYTITYHPIPHHNTELSVVNGDTEIEDMCLGLQEPIYNDTGELRCDPTAQYSTVQQDRKSVV